MSKPINIGIPIDLDRLLETRLLIQASSGGGKSYALRKLLEQSSGKVQQIILDPEGEFVTLREKFDFALVSRDGDIPLNLRYAETLAHKLLETNISAIIDLYELKHYERILFVKRFLDALINAPKELWHSCLVVVDEAHIFCPESQKAESMSSVIDLCTRGRKRGFGAVIATQRLSKLHKDAAAECLNKLIGQTGLDIDRKRAADELGFTNKAEALSLRELEQEFYAFGPAICKEVTKFKVSPVQTTHPTTGKRIYSLPPTPAAIQKILGKLQDIPEEAERTLQTVKDYKQEIDRLNLELKARPKPVAVTAGTNEIKLQKQLNDANKKVEVITNGFQVQKAFIDQVKSDLSNIYKSAQKFFAWGQKFQIVIRGFPEADFNNIFEGTELLQRNKFFRNSKNPTPSPSLHQKDSTPFKVVSSNFKSAPSTNSDAGVAHREFVMDKQHGQQNGTLPKAERKILSVLAQYPQGRTKKQIAILTVYSVNGGAFMNSIYSLTGKSLIIKQGDNYIATSEGLSLVDASPLPTGDELLSYWVSNLGKAEREILIALHQAHPEALTKAQLGERTQRVDTGGALYECHLQITIARADQR